MKGRANSVFVQEKVMGAEETVHTFTSCGVRAFPESLSQQISSLMIPFAVPVLQLSRFSKRASQCSRMPCEHILETTFIR